MDVRPSPSARDAGVDVARGLAVLLMIQTHAYDGWVRPAEKATLAYALTRVLGAIPAPLFLLLAGVGLALGEAAGLRAGRDPAALRARFVRRGVEVFAWGYGVSLAYAVIDGSFALPVLLRADILHAIGLSLVICAALLVGARAAPERAAAIAVVATVAQPILASWWEPHDLPVPVAALLGLFVDVTGYTRFPVLPLVALVACGYVAGRVIARTHPAPRVGAAALIAFALVALGAKVLTGVAVTWLGGSLSRRHPAVALNVIDGSARALAVLGAGWAIAPWVARAREGSKAALVRLGQGSLLAYAVHIPLCYGRLARPVAGTLDMLTATAGVVALSLATFAVVRARDAIRDRSRPRSTTRG